MPTPTEIERKRIQASQQAGKSTSGRVRALQGLIHREIADWLSGALETENGRIKYTAANLAKTQTVFTLFQRFQKRYEKTVLGDILDWAGRLFGLNAEYFETFTEPAESVADAARRLTLQRWGYNVTTGKLIPGGYFETLFNNSGVAQRVAAAVNQAIAQKMPLAQFQVVFRQVFVGKPGGGLLERHWKTNSFDLYQRIDRTANLVYADRLGLNYAVYSGTLEEDSRQWCIDHVNKVYSRPEIDDWKNRNWKGKNQFGYDPYMDAGGYRCRHHWSFISDEIAQRLRPELAENT